MEKKTNGNNLTDALLLARITRFSVKHSNHLSKMQKELVSKVWTDIQRGEPVEEYLFNIVGISAIMPDTEMMEISVALYRELFI